MTNPCRLLLLFAPDRLGARPAAAIRSRSAPPARRSRRPMERTGRRRPTAAPAGSDLGSRRRRQVTGLVLDANGLAAVSFAVAGTAGDPLLATWQAAASTSAGAASWTPPVPLGPARRVPFVAARLGQRRQRRRGCRGRCRCPSLRGAFRTGRLAGRRRHRDGPRRLSWSTPVSWPTIAARRSRSGSKSRSGPPRERPVARGCRQLRSATARQSPSPARRHARSSFRSRKQALTATTVDGGGLSAPGRCRPRSRRGLSAWVDACADSGGFQVIWTVYDRPTRKPT